MEWAVTIISWTRLIQQIAVNRSFKSVYKILIESTLNSIQYQFNSKNVIRAEKNCFYSYPETWKNQKKKKTKTTYRNSANDAASKRRLMIFLLMNYYCDSLVDSPRFTTYTDTYTYTHTKLWSEFGKIIPKNCCRFCKICDSGKTRVGVISKLVGSFFRTLWRPIERPKKVSSEEFFFCEALHN